MRYIWYVHLDTNTNSIVQDTDKQVFVIYLSKFVQTQFTKSHNEDFIQFSKHLSFGDWIMLRKENTFSIYLVICLHGTSSSWEVVPIRVNLENLPLRNKICFLQRNFTLITDRGKIEAIDEAIRNC